MSPSRRQFLALTAGGAIAGLLPAAATAETSPYGLQPYPMTEAAIADHPPVLWETEAILIPLPKRSNPHELGRGEERQLFITAYADGSGRIAFTRVPDPNDPWSFQLFGDDRPFIAARIDPATFQAISLGIFADAIDEPMSAVGRS